MPDVNRPVPNNSTASYGNVVAVLHDAGPLTRQQLQSLLGLSRATLVERLDTLQRLRMIRTAGHDASSGGRRAALLEADRTSRVAAVAWLGASHISVGVVDLAGTVLTDHTERLPLGHTPSDVLPWLVDTARKQLTDTGRGGDLAAVGLAVPGQIDQATGISIMPTTMTAWRDQPLRDTLADGRTEAPRAVPARSATSASRATTSGAAVVGVAASPRWPAVRHSSASSAATASVRCRT
jgi:hypothetical protein